MLRSWLAAALLALASVVTAPLSARDFAFSDPYFETIGDRDSIPNGQIAALAQDRAGFFWIGTLSGLIRYDGYSFRRYTYDADDPQSLPGNNIRAIAPAPDGTLWIACEDRGIAHYDPATDRFERFMHRDGDAGSLANDAVLDLALDADGGLWVGTVADGIDHLALGASTFRHFPVGRGAGNAEVSSVRRLLVDTRGDLWIAGTGGLDVMRKGATVFEHVAAEADAPYRLANHYVYALFEASDGRLWLGLQDDGAAVLDPRTLALRHLPASALGHPWVAAIAEPRRGELWLATFGGGLDVVDAASGSVVRRVRAQLSAGGSLAVDRLSELFVDRSGLLWIGTWGGGLHRHNPNSGAFASLRFDPQRADRPGHPAVLSALEQPDGTIWLGTGGAGIDVLDRERGIVARHRPDPQRAGALPDGIVSGLARTRDGTVYVATQQRGLLRWDGAAFHPVAGLRDRYRAMRASRSGTLFVGTEGILYELDPRDDSLRMLTRENGRQFDQAIWTMIEDPDGNLWVGTPYALWLRRVGESELARVESAHGPPLHGVQDLTVDGRGRLWVATSGGIEMLERVDGAIATFTRFPGFDAPVARLFADDRDRLWSERWMFDPALGTAYEFGRADGVDVGSPPEVGHGAKTADGVLLIGGPSGLLIVDPARFEPWSYAPPLAISAATVDGTRRDPAGGVRLVPGEKHFSVEFSALDFSAPERNRYRYLLDGYDDQWTAADARHRVASFTSLPPGSYTLRIQGTNRAGRFSAHEIALPVDVVPAFWQTLPFRIAVVLLLLGLTWPVYHARLSVVRAHAAELERTVAARTADIRAAHTKLESAYSRIEELSRTDTLTGVGNRRSLDVRLPALLAHVERGARLAFLLLDIDRFKGINDTYGHTVGDAVLRALGTLLRERENADVLATRWGGEEFLVVVRVADDAQALDWAERLRGDIAALRVDLGDGRTLAFTASIGVACYPFAMLPWQRELELADQALYAAKRGGRDRVIGVRAARTPGPDFEARLRDAPAELFADGTLELVRRS